jgi:hypothetical protein
MKRRLQILSDLETAAEWGTGTPASEALALTLAGEN